MDTQLGISFKLIHSLKRDKHKLEAVVATLREETQGLKNKGQPKLPSYLLIRHNSARLVS